MATHKLENYLKTYRRRAGFSQDEIAYLLAARSGAKTSRYERFRRTPSLETALAYEALFGVPVAPEGTSVENPAFDVTPSRYVTAIITERGVARAPYQESLAALIP